MRLRKLLLTTYAVVAVGVLALAPRLRRSRRTTPPALHIAKIAVDPFGGNVAHAMTLTMKTAQIQTAVYGEPTIVNCIAGAGNGTAWGGGITGIPLAGQVINALNLNCAGRFPGIAMHPARARSSTTPPSPSPAC